jgi:hypothetical protein
MKSFVSSDGRKALSAPNAVAKESSATATTSASGAGNDTYAEHASIVSMI